MNLRHAAAFALIGWYAIVPPGVDGFLKPEAPLSEWPIIGKANSEAECETRIGVARVRLTNAILAAELPETVPFIRQLGEGAMELRCISSDDPRLKEK